MAATATALWATRASSALLSALARRHRATPIRRPRWLSAMASPASGDEKITAPYGSWKSPITADAVSGAEKRLGGMAVAGNGRLVWVETRPEEGGCAVLVREPSKLEDNPLDIIPPEFAAQTLAQEYGGGAFAVLENMIIFSNYEDQRLHKQFI